MEINFDLNFSPSDLDETVRFPELTEDQIGAIEQNRTEVATKRATKWGIKIFKDWLFERKMDPSFENLPTDQLDELLRKFYGEVRAKSGEKYGKSAMAGIRSAINRHLSSAPFNRKINIIADKEFRRSNNMFVGLIKMMKKEGRDTTKHHCPISEKDLKQLYASKTLCNDTPESLLRKVWFTTTLYFGRRGSEGQRSLKRESFRLGRDDVGLEYIEMNINEKEKNHPGSIADGQHKQSRIYSTPDDPENCPVQAFKLYVQKLNPQNEAFYQRPLLTKPDSDNAPWYANVALGQKKLQGMMKEISGSANLSQIYTNHCLRATTCTILESAGHSTHQIMAVTGHKNESSVRSYTNRLSCAQKRDLSESLSMQLYNRSRPSTSGTSRPTHDVSKPNVRPTPSVGYAITVPTFSINEETNLSVAAKSENSSLASIFQGCHFNASVRVNVLKE